MRIREERTAWRACLSRVARGLKRIMAQRTCIITGGANGIGRCIAEAFLQEGDFVALMDIDAVSGEELQARYGEEKVFFFRGDATEQTDLDAFLLEVLKKHPRVDVLVNNACVSRGGVENCSYDDFNYVLRLGASAPFYLAKQLLTYFSPNASIVNICSTRAFMSQRNTESYSAAKGAIAALTHALSVSLAGKVRVNAISPGWIDTGAYQHEAHYTPSYDEGDTAQHPVGRVGVPEDIARAVLFLCSDSAGFITGENLVIDGGMTRQMIYHNDFGWTYRP